MSTITIDSLRSDSHFSAEEKDSLMWSLIGDDEEFIVEIEPRTHYECTLCDRSPRSQYSLVQHVRSAYHRSEATHKRQLTEYALEAVAQLEGDGFGKNFSVEGGVGEALGFICRICTNGGGMLDTMSEIIRHVKSSDHRDELAVMRSMFKLKTDSTLTLPQKVRAMWKLIQEFEEDYFARSHFERTGFHSFKCVMCEVSMNSLFNTAQHARGKTHQKKLEDAYDQSSYYSSDDEEEEYEEECEEECEEEEDEEEEDEEDEYEDYDHGYYGYY